MAFDAIVNRGEYISAHYLAELFAKDLTDLRKRWTTAERIGAQTSRAGVKGLGREFFKAKVRITETEAHNGPEVQALNDRLLTALAFIEPEGHVKPELQPGERTPEATHTTLRRGILDVLNVETHRQIPVALAVTGPGGLELVALNVTWTTDPELVAAGEDDGGCTLLDPIPLDGRAVISNAADAVTFLFGCEEAPRFVLLLAGGAVLLADKTVWHEGKFLSVNIDLALDRNLAADGGELEAIAALFGAESLLTEGGTVGFLDELVDKGRKHAVGVSKDLREGLRHSVELIAQEILDRIVEQEADPSELGDAAEVAARLTRESLRYLYRILFLLYAEARPELGILPGRDDAYQDGYGLARLGELVSYDLPEESQDGFHFAHSLSLLFRLVDQGHRPLNGVTVDVDTDATAVSDTSGLRFEALRSDLFKADATPLIGSVRIDGRTIDTRLRNKVLWRVLNLLMLSHGEQRRGRQGATGTGYISYAQLGINQLGAVYEGLMSYTGFFAAEDLFEVAKPGSDGLSGTWVVPVRDADNYNDEVFVTRRDELTGQRKRVLHKKGSFVYRLSGRERQRSASYYTPEVLTRSTVKHALAELLNQDGVPTPARAILDLTVCEPALGSGAFLNEAINQLAAEYLRRRMNEVGEQLPPDRYEAELQRVKAYLALHNCYGVDLNQTAVELAEVSLWLNAMHEGLKAPWFGMHLRRGNSLIGARRAVYAASTLKAKAWLTTVPTDRPLRDGAEDGVVSDNEIHHFLLPAKGWGAVADAKQAKELAKEERDALAAWRTQITKPPTPTMTKRLLALGVRVERLWKLTRRRLIVSEREVRRDLAVWKVPDDAPLPHASGDVTREHIEQALLEPGSPLGRLKLVMDAWCALWFWPVGQPDTPAPPTMDEWLAFCEAVLGIPVAKAKAGKRGYDAGAFGDAAGLYGDLSDFEQLAEQDQNDRVLSQCADLPSIMLRFEWLSEVAAISQREGFFHWELEYAHLFERGGFDLQVGNPPWHQPKWDDDLTLAEYDPWFGLLDKSPENVKVARRAAVLAESEALRGYLIDLNSWAGTNAHLGSSTNYPAIEGMQTNLYLNFMERVWRNSGMSGTSGLLHPESHFTDPKGAGLRATAYSRLRRFFQYTNHLLLFEEVDYNVRFGIFIYGAPGAVAYRQICWLAHPETADLSLTHSGIGPTPGVQFETGGWDLRPHRERVVAVTESVLADWAALVDELGTPALHARLLRPVTVGDSEGLRVLSQFPTRLGGFNGHWMSGLHEKGAKKEGLIEWRTEVAPSWSDVVLQGPHFTVANPFNRQPNPSCKSNRDYEAWSLERLAEAAIPRTNYARVCSAEKFAAAQPSWNGRPSTEYFRVAWRRMVASQTERGLHAALIPPGPTHVDAVSTVALESRRATAVVGGLWASLPFDYMVKTSGKTNIRAELMALLPAPLDHPLTVPLLFRTLRLNCITRDFTPLWEEIFEAAWLNDRWADPDSQRPPIQNVDPTWSMDTPLRTEYDRRMALVEIDALVAVMLGLTAEQLCAMYRSQFRVLCQYEWEMFFAPDGHKIGAAAYNIGIRQTPEESEFVKAWAKAARAGDPTPEIPAGYIKPDREKEMTRAHEDFTRRLANGEYGEVPAPASIPEG